MSTLFAEKILPGENSPLCLSTLFTKVLFLLGK